MPLQSIQHRKVFLDAMNQMKACIVAGEYRPGDKLPSEKELAQIFRISRPSVREALCGLTALGLVEAKAGGGYYVKSATPPTSLDLILLEEGNPLEILEARKIIEPEIARLAARRRIEKDVERMKHLIQRAGNYRLPGEGGSIERIIENDMEIHRSFAQACHNEVLISIQQKLLEFMRKRGWKELQKRVDVQPRLVDRYWREHKAIADWICQGRPLHAGQAMHRHLQGIARDLLKQARG